MKKLHLSRMGMAACGVDTTTKEKPALTAEHSKVDCGRCLAVLHAPYFADLSPEQRAP